MLSKPTTVPATTMMHSVLLAHPPLSPPLLCFCLSSVFLLGLFVRTLLASIVRFFYLFLLVMPIPRLPLVTEAGFNKWHTPSPTLVWKHDVKLTSLLLACLLIHRTLALRKTGLNWCVVDLNFQKRHCSHQLLSFCSKWWYVNRCYINTLYFPFSCIRTVKNTNTKRVK